MLIGFNSLKSTLVSSYHNQKLHHGILLSGKKGIGKALFAKEFCAEILGNKETNPDLLIIEKEEGKKDITVDKVRKIASFVNQTSSHGKDKFIIIDAACELNKSAANAILKILEEPHKGNFLILIAHNLNLVLPTIRSRCQLLKVPNHSFENLQKILNQKINLGDEEAHFLSEIFDNSPAQIIEFGADVVRFYQLFLRSILNKRINEEILKKLADKSFPLTIFEIIIAFFFSRLLKKASHEKIKFFFEEEQVFNEILSRKNLEEILDMQKAVAQNLAKLQMLYLDSKLCLINIFNRLSYE